MSKSKRSYVVLLVTTILGFAVVVSAVTFTVVTAYRQLKREKSLEYQQAAGELYHVLSRRLVAIATRERQRPFEHYRFLSVRSDPVLAKGTLELSPLASYDLEAILPGTIGCFQLDPHGRVSSPSLPEDKRDEDRFNQAAIAEREKLVASFLPVIGDLPNVPATITGSLEMTIPANRPTDKQTPGESEEIRRVAVSDLAVREIDQNRFALYREVRDASARWLQGCVVDASAFVRNLSEDWYLDLAVSARMVMEVYRGERLLLRSERLPEKRRHRFYAGERVEIRSEALPHPFQGMRVVFVSDRIPLPVGAWALKLQIVLFMIAIPVVFVSLFWVGARAIALHEERLRFVRMVSHELKTPIAAIKMHLEMIIGGMTSSMEQVKEYARRMLLQSDRLDRLVNNFFAVSGLGISEANFASDTMSVSQAALLLCEASEEASKVARQEVRVRVSDDIGEGSVRMSADAARSIMDNLITNAAKHAACASPVEISITREGPQFVCSVRDFGPGMSESELASVFDPFFRGANASASQVPGTGLGLAIVCSIIESLGGEIAVTNTGSGLAFVIRIPICSSTSESPGIS